jgi:recombinational DNA repair protein (RecF pathway)
MPTVREDNDKLNGIIFRLYDSKPGDRVVHLLASDGSRHVLIAKGVKKGTSKKLTL